MTVVKFLRTIFKTGLLLLAIIFTFNTATSSWAEAKKHTSHKLPKKKKHKKKKAKKKKKRHVASVKKKKKKHKKKKHSSEVL